MSERKEYDPKLVKVGNLLKQKRIGLGQEYRSREKFLENRSDELFAGVPWMSERYLASIEEGKNWISIEKLIPLAYALEMDPVQLFAEIFEIYTEGKNN